MLKNLSPYRLWWKISTPISFIAVTWLIQRELSGTRVLLLSVTIEGLEPRELWSIHLIFMCPEDVVVSQRLSLNSDHIIAENRVNYHPSWSMHLVDSTSRVPQPYQVIIVLKFFRVVKYYVSENNNAKCK